MKISKKNTVVLVIMAAIWILLGCGKQRENIYIKGLPLKVSEYEIILEETRVMDKFEDITWGSEFKPKSKNDIFLVIFLKFIPQDNAEEKVNIKTEDFRLCSKKKKYEPCGFVIKDEKIELFMVGTTDLEKLSPLPSSLGLIFAIEKRELSKELTLLYEKEIR